MTSSEESGHMSVDPGGLESGSDPQDPVIDFDEESTLDDNEVLDPIDEGDNDNDPGASVYDTSWVPDDRPSHRTDYGDTLTEMREGESLDRRLTEDEPDLLEQELGDPVDQILGERSDTEDDPNFEEDPDARLATEADDDPAVQAALVEEGGDTDVPASEFEEEQPRAGRLVEPDEGLESDTEKDMIAYDAGISGAGASAEEAAVHLTEEP
jgi:Family of unknown function (DUF5709)